MRILHLIYDHTGNPWVGGGGAVRIRELSRRLAVQHEVTVVCGRYPGAEDHEEDGVKFRFVGTGADNYVLSTFCYATRAMGYLKRHGRDADVVVEDFAPYNPVFARFLSGGTPVLLQVHHREGRELFSRYNVLGLPFMLCEAIYPRFHGRAVAVSDESREKFGIPWAEVVPNGIDAGLLNMESSDEGYICYMGRLHEHNKGLDTLLKALAKCGDVRLVIAGRGPHEQSLKDRAESLGLNERVEFRGFLDEPEKNSLVAGASLFVLPSRYEGQGIVVLEAAALGTAVVVSDIPELGYAVRARFARSFPVGDAGALAGVINELLSDRDARAAMAGRGREYASGFTWDELARKYEEMLLSAAGGAAR